MRCLIDGAPYHAMPPAAIHRSKRSAETGCFAPAFPPFFANHCANRKEGAAANASVLLRNEPFGRAGGALRTRRRQR